MAIKGIGFSTTKFFEVLLLGFIAVQVTTWILSKYYDIETIKGGWIILLFLVIVGVVTLYSTGKKLGSLTKKDLLFVFLEFIVIILAFIYLPTYIPQIFSSYSIQISETIKQSVGSVIGLTGGII